MSEDILYPGALGLDAPKFKRGNDESGRLTLVAREHGKVGGIVTAGGIEQAPLITEIVDVDWQLGDQPVEVLPLEDFSCTCFVQ